MAPCFRTPGNGPAVNRLRGAHRGPATTTCCASTAALVVSHHLDGSGSISARGMLHPSRTGFTSLRAHPEVSRPLDSAPTTGTFVTEHSPRHPACEPSRAHPPHDGPACRDVQSFPTPEETWIHWTDGRCTARERTVAPSRTPWVVRSRLSRCACTLRRTSLPHSRSGITAFASAPPPFAAPLRNACALHPARFDLEAFLRGGDQTPDPRCHELPRVLSFHGLLIPLQGPSQPPIPKNRGTGSRLPLSWHARNPRCEYEPHSPRTEGPSDVGSALDPTPR